MTHHNDAFGRPLSVGDDAYYVYSDDGNLMFCRAQVIDLLPKTVRVVISEYRHKGELDQNKVVSGTEMARGVDETKTVPTHSLIRR